jgi:D-alanyl-D-alanine carboxypeptidase (penicillin-binding protein 5/6)
MKIKKIALIFALMLGVPLLPAPCAANPAYQDVPEVDVQSRSAILVHAQTDEILYSHNIHIRREPASLTKVMTALLALEYALGYGSLDDIVTAEEGDFFDIIPGGSSAGIVPGEEMTLLDLIYCAMLISANEACNLIARHVAGSVEAFMEMLNLRLAEIGAENTRFVNTHGLPEDGHYSTAYDLYLMAKECLQNARFMEIANTERAVLSGTNKTPEGRVLNTTNDLITRRRRAEYIYPHARGIKTGRTNNAGHCLMSAAEQNGITFISVVLGSVIDPDTNYIRSFTETRDLFEWGFENFTIKTILSSRFPVASLPVTQGLDQNSVNLLPERAVEALVPKFLTTEDILRDADITIYEPGGIRAPVEQGDVLGEIRLRYGDNDFTLFLVADRSVERDNREAIQDNIGDFLNRIFGRVFGTIDLTAEDPVEADMEWIFWLIVIVIALVLLYIIFVIWLNRRRRKQSMRRGQYRGRKRY